MGAEKLKLNATEFDVQFLSIDKIEVLPDRFQTRARTDPEVVHTYSEWMRNGTDMGAVIVIKTPDGRLILADGFHRREATLKQRPKRHSIRAQVRPGTETDAILIGIEQNKNLEKLRGLSDEDKQHAVELMIRNEETRDWSDSEIASRCGFGGRLTVSKIRIRLMATEDIPLPDSVWRFSGGQITVFKSKYKPMAHGRPAIYKTRQGGQNNFKASLNGVPVYLGSNLGESEKRLDEIVVSRDTTVAALADSSKFDVWLCSRNVFAETVKQSEFQPGGMRIGDAYITCLPVCNATAILAEIGRCYLAGKRLAWARRLVICGHYRSDRRTSCIARLTEEAGEIEFMTPEEFVAEFGPQDPGAPALAPEPDPDDQAPHA